MQIEQEQSFEINQGKRKKTKITTIIAILITITVIVVIGIIIAIISMQEKELSVIIDGVAVTVPEDTFIFTEERKNICVNKRYSTICRV